MRFLSLFSGVEAASLAWEPLGWQGASLCEFDSFPSAVLAHHWPSVPNMGDITAITERQIKSLGQIDVVVFGSPCQDMSIAGKREGFNGERSSLFRDAAKVIGWCVKHCGTRFALWENVTGATTSNEGRDFSEVLHLLTGTEHQTPEQGWQNAGVAYGKKGLCEWRVFDSKYFGGSQSRRRIFAVADLGDWSGRQPVLFESEGRSRKVVPISKGSQQSTGRTDRGVVCRFSRTDRYECDGFVSCLSARDYKDARDLVVTSDKRVRGLTPVEYERILGMPDNHTKVPYKGLSADECPDGPRMKALGNSIDVRILKFIGEQLEHEIAREQWSDQAAQFN